MRWGLLLSRGGARRHADRAGDAGDRASTCDIDGRCHGCRMRGLVCGDGGQAEGPRPVRCPGAVALGNRACHRRYRGRCCRGRRWRRLGADGAREQRQPMAARVSKGNPRRSNGTLRNANRARLRAEGRPCWICREFGRPGVIDYSLPPGHPASFEVDELCPVSRWHEGGYSSPEACAADYDNLDAAHRSCNQWRSNKTVAEVRAIARSRKDAQSGRQAPVKSVSGKVSRDWRKGKPAG